ncbi:MAG: alpha/beta hydrolase [Rheinheimera sp.]|nr:alpha/beta hydrolase [Rheinheimera sp.]
MFSKTLVAFALSVAAFQAVAVPETSLPNMYPAEISAFWQQQVKTGTMKTPDGVQLAYAYVVPSQPKYALLLIQGRTEAYQKYHELYFDLAAQGVAVFSLDHRGQGLSPRELGRSAQRPYYGLYAVYSGSTAIHCRSCISSDQFTIGSAGAFDGWCCCCADADAATNAVSARGTGFTDDCAQCKGGVF